jgi:hypothetical protein
VDPETAHEWTPEMEEKAAQLLSSGAPGAMLDENAPGAVLDDKQHVHQAAGDLRPA